MKGFMPANGPFGESGRSDNFQTGLGLDDGGGLRVVNANFLDE